jgi:hypothetical protein
MLVLWDGLGSETQRAGRGFGSGQPIVQRGASRGTGRFMMQWPRPTCCSESSIALNGAKLGPCQGRAPCCPGLSLLFALDCPTFQVGRLGPQKRSFGHWIATCNGKKILRNGNLEALQASEPFQMFSETLWRSESRRHPISDRCALGFCSSSHGQAVMFQARTAQSPTWKRSQLPELGNVASCIPSLFVSGQDCGADLSG